MGSQRIGNYLATKHPQIHDCFGTSEGDLTGSQFNDWCPYKKVTWGASLVAQWLRICLPMQGTQVQSLLWEGRSHILRGSQACGPQLLKPACPILKLALCNNRSHHNEKSMHHNYRVDPNCPNLPQLAHTYQPRACALQ